MDEINTPFPVAHAVGYGPMCEDSFIRGRFYWTYPILLDDTHSARAHFGSKAACAPGLVWRKGMQ